ncbi:GIY-YIG nuclease family protein [Marinobacterium lutimaris]|uniref:GIY-YIG nuclease family protein n=1 Tax=Marinobacterium lutimaris TaxID=568106 RepID=UPI000CDF09E8|nr:GIY-YIG nuclease family protein [Marinobacterium lutimaris]
MQQWYVYILRCADDTFYTGVTTDLKRRVREHNECNRLGARYTRVRRPVQLVWSESQADRSVALKREYAIKQLRRPAKLRLISDYRVSAEELMV